MAEKFNIDDLKNLDAEGGEYEKQVSRIEKKGHQTDCILEAVEGAIENISNGHRSFVIYGQPQSGKTEMMICLTAKLLDEGNLFVVHLINDNRDLRDQNLQRFTKSGISPTPKGHKTFIDAPMGGEASKHVVFCKKNGADMRALIQKIGSDRSIIVIDDEADYASPNPKVNTGGQTPIHSLIKKLIGQNGAYIGVTATPARLDLNNTFYNDTTRWIEFKAHENYIGQDVFFPMEDEPTGFRLTQLNDTADESASLQESVLGFLAAVAFLNTSGSEGEQNFSMLIHTSRNQADHDVSCVLVREIITVLADEKSPKFKELFERLYEIVLKRYPGADVMRLLRYIRLNIARSEALILNSTSERDRNSEAATNPDYLFTFVIGGNVVSRGVTFNNLLCMFFTRGVKGKMQQDTYIQRARMFGNRGGYLEHDVLPLLSSFMS